jgi:tetratricopeptide (TPR) repeat protein
MARADRKRLTTAVLIIALGSGSLLLRAVALHHPQAGVAQAKSYMALDVKRNRTGWLNLLRYHQEQADTAQARQVIALRQARYPEEPLAREAERLINNGRYAEAVRSAQEVIAINPREPAGWLQLGRAYLRQKRWARAVEALRLSDGLNPYSYYTLTDLGQAYYQSGDREAARDVLQRAIRIDRRKYNAYWSLAQMSKLAGDSTGYQNFIAQAATVPETHPLVIKELGDSHLQRGELQRAAESYNRAMSAGLDTAAVSDLVRTHPELARWLTLPADSSAAVQPE